MILSPHEAAHVALEYWPDPKDARIAVAVAIAESGLDTDAIARSKATGPSMGQRDHGLWQISGRWHGSKLQGNSDWRDPYVNGRLARMVYDEAKQSWKPWQVFLPGKSGEEPSYVQYLMDADFGLAAPIPAPRSTYIREKALWNWLEIKFGGIMTGVDRTLEGVTTTGNLVAEIRGIYK
jgi:hypothetical protein